MCVYLRTHGAIQKASWRGWAWAQARVRDVCAWRPRTQLDDGVGRMDDVLEELLQHREPEALQQCLRKVRASGPRFPWRCPEGHSAPVCSVSAVPGGPVQARGALALGPEHLSVAYAPARL